MMAVPENLLAATLKETHKLHSQAALEFLTHSMVKRVFSAFVAHYLTISDSLFSFITIDHLYLLACVIPLLNVSHVHFFSLPRPQLAAALSPEYF